MTQRGFKGILVGERLMVRRMHIEEPEVENQPNRNKIPHVAPQPTGIRRTIPWPCRHEILHGSSDLALLWSASTNDPFAGCWSIAWLVWRTGLWIFFPRRIDDPGTLDRPAFWTMFHGDRGAVDLDSFSSFCHRPACGSCKRLDHHKVRREERHRWKVIRGDLPVLVAVA